MGNEMLDKIIGFVAFAGAVIGSTIVALDLGINWVGYVFFLASSTASVKLLMGSNASRSLLYTNLYFVVVNVVGLVRYLT